MSQKNNNTIPELLRFLWVEHFFQDEKSLKEIKNKLKEKGCNPSLASLSKALRKSSYLSRSGKRGKYRYVQKNPSAEITSTEKILPTSLIEKIKENFAVEIEDLKLNYRRSGDCTAFILRKILEKMIFLAFAKKDLSDKLKDSNGDFVGLKAMLNLAMSEKTEGKPFLMPKTGKEVQGIKFLGDTSAHNPLINVDMESVLPSMPFIITAYTELSRNI